MNAPPRAFVSRNVDGVSVSCGCLHRDDAREELVGQLSTKGWAQKWAIYEFNGPPVFASYWDWDERGGRIHISPALLGTVIGECPASDHLWCQETATDHYRKYVKHLNRLLNDIPGTSVTSRGFA